MTERGQPLHATIDHQIAELIDLRARRSRCCESGSRSATGRPRLLGVPFQSELAEPGGRPIEQRAVVSRDAECAQREWLDECARQREPCGDALDLVAVAKRCVSVEPRDQGCEAGAWSSSLAAGRLHLECTRGSLRRRSGPPGRVPQLARRARCRSRCREEARASRRGDRRARQRRGCPATSREARPARPRDSSAA